MLPIHRTPRAVGLQGALQDVLRALLQGVLRGMLRAVRGVGEATQSRDGKADSDAGGVALY